MSLPSFITFTGADDETSIDDMDQLALDYPVEFGILFSPKRQGSGRYPSLGWVRMLLKDLRGSIILSAHLCGDDARAVIQSGKSQHDALLCGYFARAQINTAYRDVDHSIINAWAAYAVELDPILQCREGFPSVRGIGFLFDASGGRGIPSAWWPRAPSGQFVGYAGGLNPSNVAAAVAEIGTLATDYWIDMETGVRDEHDRFSIEKCRAVCEAVYGVRKAQ